MRKLLALVAVFALAALLTDSAPAAADRGVSRFATLPENQPGHPEGIAADAAGNIYAASFDFSGVNSIYVFGPNGRLEDTIALNGHVPLGMQFGPDGKLYVADFGNGAVLQLAPPSHAITRTYPVCTGGGTTCGLNGITFDAAGLLYVSDSFGGNIFTVNTTSGTVGLYVHHDLLTPGNHGFPGFGANGISFRGTDLYVANTADDRILKISASKVVTTFTESINGADGIAWDSAGRLWVCANQENVLYVLNTEGRVLDIIGGFEGIKDGTPQGLLFPASVVQSRGSIYVTNTALDFRHFFADETPITRFTISRVRLNPSLGDD
ncbi:MAG TPA: NHL repeat-containing protein [Candidatus Limnocylindria bacterium]